MKRTEKTGEVEGGGGERRGRVGVGGRRDRGGGEKRRKRRMSKRWKEKRRQRTKNVKLALREKERVGVK